MQSLSAEKRIWKTLAPGGAIRDPRLMRMQNALAEKNKTDERWFGLEINHIPIYRIIHYQFIRPAGIL